MVVQSGGHGQVPVFIVEHVAENLDLERAPFQRIPRYVLYYICEADTTLQEM